VGPEADEDARQTCDGRREIGIAADDLDVGR
ncbi:MAG: hypothetical protein QOI08_1424, partial [Actinomycetota bacterium]|nr:hypothetical protein [Actinomycetota bacterium]